MRYPTLPERQRARAQLFLGGVLLVGALGLTIANTRWIVSVWNGPAPITLTELRQLQDPATLPNPWVSFTFNQVIDTGLLLSSRRNFTTTTKARYLLVQVGDRWLITALPANHAGNQV